MSVKIGTFTVPVDLQALKSCREAHGYKSARKLHDELRRLGYALNYRAVEQTNNHGKEKRIQSATADIIAKVLGVEPEEAFPQYAAAREAAESAQAQGRYKPFTTLPERDKAIVEHLEIVQRAVRSYRYLVRNPYGILYVETDELYSIAFEVLVVEADKAMRVGILEGYDFTKWVLVSLKSAFRRLASKEREMDSLLAVQSLDTYVDGGFWVASNVDIEGHVTGKEEIRERLLREIKASKHNKRFVAMLEELDRV